MKKKKKVILFINMARYDGALFAETFLEAYLTEKDIGRNRYVRSLFRDLNKISGLAPLEPERDLTTIAQEHASATGEAGRTGHGDFNRRFEPLLGNPYQGVAENLAYGHETAIDVVLSLLIDEGIRGLGHRKNILNPRFNAVGVAMRPHRTYRINCVIDFGALNP
ncbi:MAG: CAP domain-containing protein [Bacteroidales bacterium]